MPWYVPKIRFTHFQHTLDPSLSCFLNGSRNSQVAEIRLPVKFDISFISKIAGY